jgi:hypothetical protein
LFPFSSPSILKKDKTSTIKIRYDKVKFRFLLLKLSLFAALLDSFEVDGDDDADGGGDVDGDDSRNASFVVGDDFKGDVSKCANVIKDKEHGLTPLHYLIILFLNVPMLKTPAFTAKFNDIILRIMEASFIQMKSLNHLLIYL